MSVIDIILGSLLLIGIVRGFIKGLFVEVASIVALIAGVYGAIHFSNYAASFLIEKVDWKENTINITAFIITFVVIVLAIALAGKALTKLADFAALGLVNRLLGAVFGGLKYALILSVVLIIFEKMNLTMSFIDEDDYNESRLYTPIKSFIPMILPSIITSEEEDKTTEDNII
ncbi:CvpA family protein [Aestuariivivens sediminicola]|uniref:CvpA family protein n=1 Tax=Aestuariivivens sediminicola TaxID=2913560 RepID=UPI001F58145A|nr:CvpA family protein [Aestuariivivens sediminicola]